MKVLQVNKSYFPRVGGVETVVKQLAEGLSKRDIEVKVIACNENNTFKNYEEKIHGVDVLKCNSLGLLMSTPISPSFFSKLKKEIPKYDIIHFHIPYPFAEIYSNILSKELKDKKVIITFHADPALTRWKKVFQLYAPYFFKMLKRADKIVTTAPNNLSYFKSLHNFKSKCEIIPLAADFDASQRPKSTEIDIFKERLNLKHQKTFLFVGRLNYYKGVKVLLEAFKNINANLIIVGTGQLDEELKNLVKELNIEDKVTFTGYASDADMPFYFSISDIFVLPSITPSEAFGIVQAEALSYGLPVINTNLPTGVPYVSLDKVTGITVAPNNVIQLENALFELINNQELYNKYKGNALERSKLFNINTMVNNYIDCYSSL